jgi:hypothetical protein
MTSTHPWLPLPVRLLNAVPDAFIRRLTRLDEQRLLQRAIQATGLDDFGDEDFRAPFRLLLEDLNTLDHFTPMGRITVQTVLHEQLCSRLCLQEQLKRQPDIAQHKIDRPVFIAGLPRTGTTHLHNLLSQCTQLRYLPLWQTLHPIAPQPGQADRRRRAADLAVNATGFIIPLFKRMHEMATDAPHEELTLCALGYRSFFFEGAFQVPKYRDWYANHSQVKGYAFLKAGAANAAAGTGAGRQNVRSTSAGRALDPEIPAACGPAGGDPGGISRCPPHPHASRSRARGVVHDHDDPVHQSAGVPAASACARKRKCLGGPSGTDAAAQPAASGGDTRR